MRLQEWKETEALLWRSDRIQKYYTVKKQGDMIRYIKLIIWRRRLRVGDMVAIKVSKTEMLTLKIFLTPSLGEVDVYNPKTASYESYKLRKVYQPCK